MVVGRRFPLSYSSRSAWPFPPSQHSVSSRPALTLNRNVHHPSASATTSAMPILPGSADGSEKGETRERLFGECWIDVARFNRVDRRHVRSGVQIKVPKCLEEIVHFTPPCPILRRKPTRNTS